MDLPTCPACGQSVLDDDVDECPFCGASMSGKPAAGGARAATKAAPARPAAAAKAAPASKSDGGGPAAQAGSTSRAPASPGAKAAAKEAAKADDDPFAVDDSAHAKAVPLLPQPAKGRRHAVKCPMCETVGYTSTKAAGREVRCANPKCLVPIFTAPAIEKPSEPETEAAPKPRFTTGMLAGISAVALVAIGVCLYLFVFRDDAPAAGGPVDGGQPILSGAAPRAGADRPSEADNQTDVSATSTDRREPAPIPPAQLRQRAFESMLQASREGHQNRRSLSVRLMAEAYAASGNIPEAYEQLKRLQDLRPVIPYYAIPPLVEIAWQHLANGRRDDAQGALNAALVLKREIAQLSQDPWEAAVGLAALMVAFNQDRDAAALLRDRDREEERASGVLWAQIREAHAYRSYDLDQVAANSPLKPWKNPPFVAVVFDLGAHGEFEAARRWASGREDLEERADGLAAWAESLVRERSTGETTANPLSLVQQAVSGLSPPLQSFVLARMAFRQAVEGGQAGAAATLQAARETLAGVRVPAASVLPGQSPAGLRSVLEMRLANTAELELAAIAAAEAARVAAQLGRTDEAWELVEQALAFTRGIGPSRSAVRPWLELMRNRNSLDYQLGLALDTTSTDRKRTAFSTYRSIVEQLARKSDARLELQANLLSRAIHWKLSDRVWQALRESATAQDADPWLTTDLPWRLAAHFEESGAGEQAQAVTALLEQNRIQRPLRVHVQQDMSRFAREGKLKEAVRAAEHWPLAEGSRHRDEAERNRWILRLAARLVKDGKTQAALQWLQAFQQPTFILLRQEGYDLTAALATRRGDAQKVWQFARSSKLDPVERAAALRGMIVSLAQAPAAEPAP